MPRLSQWTWHLFKSQSVEETEEGTLQEGDLIYSTLDQEEQLLEEVAENDGAELAEDVWVETEPSKPVYIYGQAVPESETVSSEYFADACIIGDSRSQGLMAFGGMEGANFTGLGLSVYNLWEKGFVPYGGSEITVLQALEKESFGKIYIGLGINSLGYPSIDRFYSNYSAFIDEIRARQPEAEIYVQSIIPLNETILRAKGSGDYFSNDNVEWFNSYIQKIAEEKNLYYLDLYNYFLDEAGQLSATASGDGIHLNAEYAKRWAAYLRSHCMTSEQYDIQSISQGEWNEWEIYTDIQEGGEVAAS